MSNLPKWAGRRTPAEIIDDGLPKREPKVPEASKGGILSAAEVMEKISALADSGEGADRRWALKMLSAQGTSAGLPEPLDDTEAILRLARLLEGYGRAVSFSAFRRAFRKKVEPGDPIYADIEVKIVVPQSLKEFFDRFPEQRPRSYPAGYPKGFPYKGDSQERKLWIEERSRYLIAKERRKQRRIKDGFEKATEPQSVQS